MRWGSEAVWWRIGRGRVREAETDRQLENWAFFRLYLGSLWQLNSLCSLFFQASCISLGCQSKKEKAADEESNLTQDPLQPHSLRNRWLCLPLWNVKRKDSCMLTSILFLNFSLCCKRSNVTGSCICSTQLKSAVPISKESVLSISFYDTSSVLPRM